jgi:drug/metabolite transporter (DMT)-like permease
MVRTAVALGLVTMVLWGGWSATAKVATRYVAPETAMTLSYGTGALVALAYVVVAREGAVSAVSLPPRGVALALVAGVLSGIGGIAFYAGLQQGESAVVTTVSAMYFIVAAIVGVLVLGETVGVRELAGIGFAVVAVALLAG